MKNLRKNTDAQHMLNAHVPWYRARKFWIVFLCLLFLINITLFILFGFTPDSLLSIINLAIYALGGGMVHAVYATLLNNPQNISSIVSLIYIPLFTILLLTFIKRKSTLISPLTISIFMLVSLTMAALLSASAG